jgi:Clp amino terminal domain, pathogenicity island component
MTGSSQPLVLPWQAMAEAARLDAREAGVEHFLLALCDQPTAADVLRELGVTRDQIERDYDPGFSPASSPQSSSSETKGAGLRGDGDRIYGFALGLARAWGEQPGPAHFLLAIAYEYASVLSVLGTNSATVVQALRRRGHRVPDAEPPVYQPWRDTQEIEVSQEELKPLLAVLKRKHPPGSDWRWGFGWTDDDPPRRLVSAEGGIDLEAALSESRGQVG